MSSEPRIVRLASNLWINLNHLVAVIPVDRDGRYLMVTLWDGAQRTCVHVKQGSDEEKVLERALALFDLRMPPTNRQVAWFHQTLIYLDEGWAPVFGGKIKDCDRLFDDVQGGWIAAMDEVGEEVEDYTCVVRLIPKAK